MSKADTYFNVGAIVVGLGALGFLLYKGKNSLQSQETKNKIEATKLGQMDGCQQGTRDTKANRIATIAEQASIATENFSSNVKAGKVDSAYIKEYGIAWSEGYNNCNDLIS